MPILSTVSKIFIKYTSSRFIIYFPEALDFDKIYFNKKSNMKRSYIFILVS